MYYKNTPPRCYNMLCESFKKCKNHQKMCSKSIENISKINLWAFLGIPFGATLEPLGKHLAQICPKDWILEALGKVLGAQDGEFGSNLEAQDPPKSRPKL